MTAFISIGVEHSHYTKGGERWNVLSEDGDVILNGVRDPWHETARVLLADGAAEPDDVMLIHRGGMHIATGRVGHLAGLMVIEGQSTSVRTVPFREHPLAHRDDEEEDAESVEN